MKYSYTARDSKGAMARGSIDADSRASAIRELSSRGVTPVSLREGADAGDAPKRRPLGAISWLVFLLLAALAIFLARRLASGKPGLRTPRRPPPASTYFGSEKAKARPAAPVAPGGAKGVPAPGAEAHGRDSGGASAAKPAQPIRGAQQRAAEAAARGEEAPKPYFKYDSESILAIYTEPGADVIPHPIPPNFEEDMRAALKEDIVVNPADSPEIERRKEMVAWIKEDMKQFVANGGTCLEYLEKLKEAEREDARLYREAGSLMREFIAQNDDAQTLEAYNQLNAELKKKGIIPLRLPVRVRARLGIK